MTVQKGDIVRYRADFITAQFRTKQEQVRKAQLVGDVLEIRHLPVTSNPAAIVRWYVGGRPEQLVNPTALEVIGVPR